MILIADSGSTKTSWLLINSNSVIQEIVTAGYNPYYYKSEALFRIINDELIPELLHKQIKKIFFYGSGCSSKINNKKVETALRLAFKSAQIQIDHDLTGAAVALLKNNEGIACILGTGSNSCMWDGNKIVENVPSVGYLLGDEGSGTYIGMKILKGIMEGKAPDNIIKHFYKEYDISFNDILTKIYGSSEPNRFFASISKFTGTHINNEWVKAIVKQCFNDFINNTIKQYSGFKNLEVCFVGSIAFYFSEILLESCHENGIITGIIIKEPIDGLMTYHTQ